VGNLSSICAEGSDGVERNISALRINSCYPTEKCVNQLHRRHVMAVKSPQHLNSTEKRERCALGMRVVHYPTLRVNAQGVTNSSRHSHELADKHCYDKTSGNDRDTGGYTSILIKTERHCPKWTLANREESVINPFEEIESNVRYYCRRWPAVFSTAHGATIVDEDGVEYLDFFAGAGVLSYGHNNPLLVDVAIEHLRAGKLLHSLDTFTVEKRSFLETMQRHVLAPRNLDMVIQTVGPTGATAVEAALQLAQRITGNRAVVGFAGSYHGMTYRAASISASMAGRKTSAHLKEFVALPYVDHVSESDIELLDRTLRAPVDGERVGALIIEPTQGEGGARPFDPAYLRAIRELCSELGVLVIADEVQAGVGRTGSFFSFEGSSLDPDIVCVSKAISGLGLPMALNLVRRGLDTWNPGEFSGTFRGNNLAFATSAAMLENYWADAELEKGTERRGHTVREALQTMSDNFGKGRYAVRGNGLLCGLDVGDTQLATDIAQAAFDRRLIVETCGAGDTTVKLLPPIVIDEDQLNDGLTRLGDAVAYAHASR
jgi:diaminobutyrate-2-oxoglutarate transaminase